MSWPVFSTVSGSLTAWWPAWCGCPGQEFTLWNILGAVFWTGVWGLGTYFFEKNIAPVHLTLSLVEPWIVALSLLGLLAVLLYVLWPKRKVNT